MKVKVWHCTDLQRRSRFIHPVLQTPDSFQRDFTQSECCLYYLYSIPTALTLIKKYNSFKRPTFIKFKFVSDQCSQPFKEKHIDIIKKS